MIPAILSCVFVIYLYQSLNADPANEDATSPVCTENDSPSQKRLTALADRIRGLESRIKIIDSKRRGQS